MKTIKRESIDVGTVLSSASKRMQSASGILPKEDHSADLPVEPQTVVENPQLVTEKPRAHRTRIKAGTKRTMRFIAKHVYKCLKPLVKPIAFRTRQYFLAGFNDVSINFAQQQQASTQALLSQFEALEHRIASIAATQRLTAQQLDQISRTQQEVPVDLLQQMKRIEELASAQLGAPGDLLQQIKRIEELTSAQLGTPGDLLQQMKRIEELTSAQLGAPGDLLQQIKRIEELIGAQLEVPADLLQQIKRIEELIGAQREAPADLLQQIKRIEEHIGAQLEAPVDLLKQFKKIEELIGAQLDAPVDLLHQIKRIEELLGAQLDAPTDLLQQIKRIEEYTYASARRIAVNCGPDEIMIRSEIGFVLCSASDHALISILLEAGELEPGTRKLIQKILRPGDSYIDVGANIGMHMLAAARAMQGSGKIIGFEPFGPTKALIDKTMWINGFSNIAETHQVAVSNKSGSQLLNMGATSGHHSLFELDTPTALAKPPVQVDLTSLDEIIDPDLTIHLLKIDAEGAELDVIDGATRLLNSNPQIKLIVELGLSHLERAGHTIEDWLEKFRKLGFDYQIIDANSGELEAYSFEKLKASESVNLFFAKAKNAQSSGTKA
jgi:FkbM family methyltransferase